MASNAVRELIVSVKMAVDQTSMSNANKAIDKLKKQANSLAKSKPKLRISADNTKALSSLQKLKQQANNIAKTNHKLRLEVNDTQAVSSLRRIKQELRSISGQSVSASVNVARNGGVGGVMRSVNGRPTLVPVGGGSSKKTHDDSGSGIKNIGRGLADNGTTIAATGAAIAAPIALPIKTAVDFEFAMSKVKAITNSTDEDMQKLTNTARELGAKTQFSASEAAAAMSYLGMAGWKTEQIIAGMPGLLDLAAASGEDLALVADIVSDDLTAFKLPAEEAAHMADVMAAASTNANTNVSLMGATFKYAGAIAGSLGYSIEDVAAATGLMANSGIKGEMAGTALRSILTRLIKPPKEAAEALEQLGVSATKSDGTVKTLREQLKELRDAMSGLTDAEKAEMGASIAGQEAMSGFLSLINASDDDFNKMIVAVDNADGAASRMAATMNDNTIGSLRSLKSAFEELLIVIGDNFTESMKGGIESLTEFIRTVGEFAKEHPQLVSAFIAIAGVLGSLLTFLGIVGIAISGLTTSFQTLGETKWAKNLSNGLSKLKIGFGPLIAIIIAVASVIYFVQENWETVVALFKPAILMMQGGLIQLQQAFKHLQPLIKALEPLLNVITNIIGFVIVAAVAGLADAFSAAFYVIGVLINGVCVLLGGMGTIIDKLTNELRYLINLATDFLGLTNQMNQTNLSALESTFEGYVTSRSGAANNYQLQQTNTFNLSDERGLLPAAQTANQWFANY